MVLLIVQLFLNSTFVPYSNYMNLIETSHVFVPINRSDVHDITSINMVIYENLNMSLTFRKVIQNSILGMLSMGRNINSFSKLILQQMLILDNGVPTLDAHSGEIFSLRSRVTQGMHDMKGHAEYYLQTSPTGRFGCE